MADEVQVVVAAAHRIVRGVIDLACREAGVAVVDRAETAADAATACRDLRPDLLVLDLDLPDADGLRILADLGAMRPPRVLVLADRADGDAVLRSLQLGVRGYVTKGDGLRDLAGAIRRVVAGERVMAPELHDGAVAALGDLARRARESADVSAGLTKRERQVLELLSEGFTVGQVATRLRISPRTVETHVAKLYRKLGVRTRLQAVSRAASLGLVDL
jgi:DNA-binding NarL/FixJ family response regulator